MTSNDTPPDGDSDIRRADELAAALFRIAEEASRPGPLEDFCAAVHAIVGGLMEASNFYIALYDADKGTLSFPFFTDEHDEPPGEIPLGRGATAYVLRTGQPLLAHPGDFAGLHESGEIVPMGEDPVDWLGVPLISGGRAMGVVAVQSYRPEQRYNALHKKLLTFVARHIALVLEQRRAVEALRQSEERYRAIAESASDVIVSIDEESIVRVANRAVAEVFGHRPEELIGRPLTELMPEPYRERHRRGLARYLASGERQLDWQRIELPGLHRSGRILPLEVSFSEIHEGGARRFVGIMRDISERKRADEDRERSLSLLQATLDAGLDGILVVDSGNRIVSYNRRFVEMWRPPQEVLDSGDDEALIAFVLDQLVDPEGFLAKIRDLHLQPATEGFDVLRFKDGKIVERTSRPQLLGEEIVGRVWSFHDVTVQRNLEDQLRQSQKMEAVGRLAGGVAHDFNNLLTAILGYAEVALRELPDDASSRADIEEIRRAGTRAAELTRQLLAFGRRQVLLPAVIDLNVAVREMESLLRRLLPPDVEIETRLAADLGTVRADRGQIEQVVVNLVVNARDAMPAGGRVTLATSNVEISGRDGDPSTAAGVAPGRYALLAVSDNGSGMDEATRREIFEPFFTTKGKGSGSGLGLSTVYGIVKQSGGHIAVHSEPGRGSTFEVYLPREEGSVGQLVEPALASDDAAGDQTLLLVEDEPAVRALAAKLLRRAGYVVHSAASAEEALTIAASDPSIDGLVTDIGLPDMDGVELARHLGRERPELRVLFISGYSENAAFRDRGMEDNASFLQKPFTAADLIGAVRTMSQRR